MRYDRSKSEATTCSLWEAQTKTAKKDYFTKNLSSPTFLKINTLNFQEMFRDIFKKYCRKEFQKKNEKENYKKKKQKKQFLKPRENLPNTLGNLKI